MPDTEADIQRMARQYEERDAREYEEVMGEPPTPQMRDLTRRWYARHFREREVPK